MLEREDFKGGYREAQRRIFHAFDTRSTELDLSGLQLKKWPPELWRLTNLTKLDLSDNYLKDVSVEIRQLTKLTNLNLDRNKLSKLPPELGQLAYLKELSIDQNPDLMIPTPQIISEGTEAVLSYLRELDKG